MPRLHDGGAGLRPAQLDGERGQRQGGALDVFRPGGVAPPRVIPLGTRLPFLKTLLRAVTGSTRLWSALDHPRIAQFLGLYWFVVGRKAGAAISGAR